jgi:spermidine synthase
MQTFCKKLFKHAKYGYTCIPTYPSGQIGFVICSESADVSTPVRPAPEGMKYYTSDIHKAAFVLPKFMQDKLN